MTEQQGCELWAERARQELRVLARISAGRDTFRASMARVQDWGVTCDWFSQDDTIAIYYALEIHVAMTPAQDGSEGRFWKAASLLNSSHLWNWDDRRDFVEGMKWGPGPLACLFYRLPFDEHALLLGVSRLGDLVERTK